MAHSVDPLHQETRSTTDRPIGELIADLTRETTTLVRQEVALAKQEVSHSLAAAGKDLGMVVGGAVVAYIGVLAVVAAIIIALAHVMPWWLASLLVGIVLIAGGAMLVMRGIDALKSANLIPRRTVQTLKEDASWTTHEMS